MSHLTIFTSGDTGPGLSGGVGMDVTGATIELHLRRPDRTVLTRTAEISSATAGHWLMPWVEGDLDHIGWWMVEAQVTFSNVQVQTVGPAEFKVRKQIA